MQTRKVKEGSVFYGKKGNPSDDIGCVQSGMHVDRLVYEP